MLPAELADFLTSLSIEQLDGLQKEIRLVDIPGWDSFSLVQMIIALEERAGRELSEAEIESLVTLDDLARLLSATVEA